MTDDEKAALVYQAREWSAWHRSISHSQNQTQSRLWGAMADALESQPDLERVKREAGAAALREFAELTEIGYREDLFAPMSKQDHDAVNAILSANASVSRDRISADMMRFAAALARAAAVDIERGE